MIKLADIENIFNDFYSKTISIRTFETWLYEHSEIENLIGGKLFFGLLDISYRKKYAYLEVEKLILPYIDFGRNETQRLTGLLKNIVNGDGDIYKIMSQLYDDYCHGYYFLRYLGLSYVSSGIEEDIGVKGIRSNPSVSIAKYRQEANRLICFFEKGELKISNEFEYKDYRKEDDKIELNKIEKMFKSAPRERAYSKIQLWLQKISSYWFYR